MLLEISVIFILIVLNGVFSMSEIAIVSSRKSRLDSAAAKGEASAKNALELANSPNRFLSTVQIGITLIGILTGVFGGAQIAEKLQVYLIQVSWLEPYAEPVALSIVVLAITYLSLVIGELVPKRIGMQNPEGIAKVVAIPMHILSKICAPVVWLLSISTDIILSIFRLKPSKEPAVTEEEIRSIIQHGAHAGIIEAIEQDIVERVFNLGDRTVGSIMTNKLDIEWLDINDSFEKNRSIILESAYFGFPLCRDTIDEVIGIVYTKNFLKTTLATPTVDLSAISEQPIFIPQNMRAFQVLKQFQETKARMAIVVDEYGSVQGIVTFTDLFEALVGELSTNEKDSSIVKREDGTYLVDALIPVAEFMEYFDIEIEVDLEGFNTVGGLIIDIAERIPATGDKFTWNAFTFEVIDMDGNRIDKVLVRNNEG